MFTKHKWWGVWLITLALLWFSVSIPTTTASQPPPFKETLVKAAQELLIADLGLKGRAYQMDVLDVQTETTSARVDVELTTEGPLGEITETIHVFAIYDGAKITAIFREPSPAFYEYAWDVSPKLLPREQLLFWQDLWETEHANGAYAPNSAYKLPFTGGERKYVYQDSNKHFDFSGGGWIARAARGGQAKNGVGNAGEYYTRVTHSDGTYGWYVHLQANSWFHGGNGGVYNVNQGDCIGITGSTGNVTGAHLHFNVSTTSDNCTGCNGGCEVVDGCMPKWVAISFTEGGIPDGGYSPVSQNSTASCSDGCCGCGVGPTRPDESNSHPDNGVQVRVSRDVKGEILAIPPDTPSNTTFYPTPLPPQVVSHVEERNAARSIHQSKLSPVASYEKLNGSSAPVENDVVLSSPASTNYILAHSVVGVGGGAKSSSSFTMHSTSGQAYQPEHLQGSSYQINSGFWGKSETTSSCPPSSCTPGRDVGRDFFVGVIGKLNDVPLHDLTVEMLEAWKSYEDTPACWNPLATTRDKPDSCEFDSNHIRHYLNQAMGIEATAETLALSDYTHIRAMLKLETFDREVVRGDLAKWGTCSGSSCDSLLDTWWQIWNRQSTRVTNLSARPGVRNIELSWEPASYPGITGYYVYRSTTPDGTFTRLVTTTVNGDHFLDTTVISDTTYYYYVTSVLNDGTEIAPSNVVSAVAGSLSLFIPDDLHAPAGSVITVPVNIGNANGLQIGAMDIFISYNPQVITPINVERTILTLNHGFALNTTEEGKVRIALAGEGDMLYGEGTLFKVGFRVLSGTAGMNSSLPFDKDNTDLYTTQDLYHPVSLELRDGLLSVKADARCTLGDVNADGKINAADAALVLQIAVGGAEPNPECPNAGDVNGDGRINAADAALILRMVTGSSLLPTETQAAKLATEIQQDGRNLVLGVAEGVSGSTIEIPLTVDHAEGIAGIDVVIGYDTRYLEYDGVETGALTGRFEIEGEDLGAGKVKVSLADEEGLSGGGGELTRIRFRIREGSPSGLHTRIALVAGRLSDQYGRDFATSALQEPVSFKSGEVRISYTVYLPLLLRSR